jgi:Tol biopolymer transport system component
MTVGADPKPPAPREVETPPGLDPLEALIEEARRRARRRRQLYGLSLTLAAAALIGLFAGRSGGSHATADVSPRVNAPRVNVAAAALKTAGRLTVIGAGLRLGAGTKGDGWYDLSAVAPSAYIVRCPGHAQWCGEVLSIDWSANGRWLALSVTSVGAANPYNGIHVVDLTTGIDRQIRDYRGGEDYFDLDWSPDGSRLAYVEGWRIYIINRDGSGRRQLQTGTAGTDSSPSWSPDGRQIVFANILRAPRPHTRSSVYRVRPDGTDRILLVHGASDPTFSPDGTTIAVNSHCGGIKLITFAGRDVTPGTGPCRVIGIRGKPVWSPNGRRIAIVGHRGPQTFHRPPGVYGPPGVYVMSASGEHLRVVTSDNSTGVTGRPDASWQPRRQS